MANVLEAPQNLDGYLEACTNRYTRCLDSLAPTTTLPGLVSTARFHYVKLDSNGRPLWKDLAKNLATQILFYCFAVQKRRQAVNQDDVLELRQEAQAFFRDSARSGEAGEILLYFLQEAVLRAPQLVAKISLKTNPNLETFGSDGIHAKWDEKAKKLDLYFGEAKLHKSLSAAARDAAKSIVAFHKNDMEDFELRMVTGHFKHLDGPVKDAIFDYVKTGKAARTVRINHACLLGYNSTEYARLPRGDIPDFDKIFRERYLTSTEILRKSISKRFSNLRRLRLRFEVFVLPFGSVDQFRKAFLKAL